MLSPNLIEHVESMEGTMYHVSCIKFIYIFSHSQRGLLQIKEEDGKSRTDETDKKIRIEQMEKRRQCLPHVFFFFFCNTNFQMNLSFSRW